MFNLNPKEDKFFKMFEEEAQIVYESAIVLKNTIETLDNKEFGAEEIERLEHKGHQMVHLIIHELNMSFITPIDREDIYEIIKGMDNILDLIDSTMHRFIMFSIDKCTDEAKLLCNMIVESTRELTNLMNELRLIGKSNNMNTFIHNINQIEISGDKVFRKTVGNLFSEEEDILNIIKWKEIYQKFEDTLDSCEKVGNIVEGVVMKHA